MLSSDLEYGIVAGTVTELYVTNDRIYVIEAGGRREVFAEAETEVAAAMSGFRVQ